MWMSLRACPSGIAEIQKVCVFLFAFLISISINFFAEALGRGISQIMKFTNGVSQNTLSVLESSRWSLPDSLTTSVIVAGLDPKPSNNQSQTL